MELNEPITLRDLLSTVRSKRDRSVVYCVYGNCDSTCASLDSNCYPCCYPEISADDEEQFPEFVLDNNLELWFRDELVQDVVENAVNQLNNVSDSQLLVALEYYNQHDCFMELT